MGEITISQEKEFIKLYTAGMTARDAAKVVGISNTSSQRVRIRNNIPRHSLSQSYAAIHQWLAKNFHKELCEDCGALSSEVKLDWANISGKYYRDRDDFKSLCRSCHRKFDYARSGKCKKGLHKMVTDNIYVCPRGWNNCKECMHTALVNYKQKEIVR